MTLVRSSSSRFPFPSAFAAASMAVVSVLAAGTAGAQGTTTAQSTAASSPRAAHADSSFLKDAAEAGYAEIDAGKLALQKVPAPR
ncbi:hypothetical protein ACQ86G_23520 [Roseateles chitinivorans]|uniref:hypothetical protein n=1 Tax=Roseateles chitinivorans TaxID=2917965 RepID=UPI003D66A0A2